MTGSVCPRYRAAIQVKDANGQALAYVYARETLRDAQIANVLTEASNIAKLPELFRAKD